MINLKMEKRGPVMAGKPKKAQVTIFIILAIVIVVGIGLFFLLRGKIFQESIPQELEQVYDYYLSCIEDETLLGIDILGQQGGYIEKPEFIPGSEYMPFSNQLDFFGNGVPYWYYVSGNGIIDENVPSKTKMQEQLNNYVEEMLDNCDFSDFEGQGFEINIEDADVSSSIKKNLVEVQVKQDLSISFGEISWRKTSHSIDANSQLGKFYDLAKKIYSKERNDLFLEVYGIDVLRNYAPVDGVELTCSPKVWIQNEIKEDLKNGLEANIQAIKLKGDYYNLKEEKNKYFVQDIGQDVDVNINFLYSKDWPTKIEIYPDEDPLIAEPAGNQQGLGILGFCYVPYHFVYDMTYPVLIQLYGVNEMFQFPVSVVIDKNQPIEGLDVQGLEDIESEVCKYKNQELSVYTYDIDLNPVEAEIEFECLGSNCDIGKTEIQGNDAVLVADFPQCVNGYVVTKAEGYVKKRYLYSTNQGGEVNIVLDKLYDLDVNLKVDEQNSNNFAVINFVSEDHTQVIAWPEQNKVSLSEGAYNISVYVYSDSSINIPAMKKQECVEAPKSGLAGVFGLTEEKCFDIDIPSQQLTNVISAGGKSGDYFVESMLEKGKVEVNVQGIGLPKSLEELQDSYNLIEIKPVYLEFIE